MTTTVVIDAPALREHLGPNGPWAKDAGEKIRNLRKTARWTETQLAAMVGVTAQTIRQIEDGRVVPRDYLRSALAYALGQNVEHFWPPLTRTQVGAIGTVL